DASEPPRDSAAYLRWQTDRALHEAIVDELAGRTPSDAITNLRSLARGPLSDEVQARLGRAAGSSRVAAAIASASAPLLPQEGSEADAASPRLPWLTAADFAAGLAAALLAAGLAAGVRGIDRVPIDNVRGAWTLAWDPARQALTVSPNSADAPRS